MSWMHCRMKVITAATFVAWFASSSGSSPSAIAAEAPEQDSLPAGVHASGMQSIPSDSFRFEEVDDRTVRCWEGDSKIFAYNHGVITGKNVPETDHRRQRSSYVHPVWGLDGEILTDDFPEDHYHHHGIFWTWPHVGIEEQEYDLWAGDGIIDRFVGWLDKKRGPGGALLGVENGWYVGDRKVMIEKVWIRVHRRTSKGSAAGEGRAIDFEFCWIPVDRPITLWGAGGKSYGGMTMRFGPRTDIRIAIPSGRTSEDLIETPLAWADMSARFSGSPTLSGAAIFVHPTHPDYPPTWLTRHYGMLCVGWPGVHPRTFEPGMPIRTGYRVWIHREPSAEQLARAYSSYAVTTGRISNSDVAPADSLHPSLEATRSRP